MQRLRGDRRGQPLTQQEHDLMFERAMQGSRKDAARETHVSTSTARDRMKQIFEKLGVEDITSAYWAMGWLRPLPYGVSAADVRDEQMAEGERILTAFWGRMKVPDEP
jgi:hypothetical protein